MAKTSLSKEEQKEYLKREMGKVKRGTGDGMIRYEVFQDKLLHIHLGGYGLTVLIDICKLHNSLYCTCLCHNSVCYTQMYVCIKYI